MRYGKRGEYDAPCVLAIGLNGVVVYALRTCAQLDAKREPESTPISKVMNNYVRQNGTSGQSYRVKRWGGKAVIHEHMRVWNGGESSESGQYDYDFKSLNPDTRRAYSRLLNIMKAFQTEPKADISRILTNSGSYE